MDSRTEITGEKMDELRRLAEAAAGRDWYTLSSDFIFKNTRAYINAASPDVILALLDRASSPARSAEGVTDEMVQVAALAIRTNGVCGCTLNGETVFCDNPGLPKEVHDPECLCKSNARAALEAALSITAQPGTEAEAGEPVAWRCYDKAVGTWSVTDSAELVRSRARRPQDWVIEPLYTTPVSLASRVQELEAENAKLHRLIGNLDPQEAFDDTLLRDIHMRLQTHGEKYPERMVSVLHRNVVFYKTAEAFRAALTAKED